MADPWMLRCSATHMSVFTDLHADVHVHINMHIHMIYTYTDTHIYTLSRLARPNCDGGLQSCSCGTLLYKKRTLHSR